VSRLQHSSKLLSLLPNAFKSELSEKQRKHFFRNLEAAISQTILLLCYSLQTDFFPFSFFYKPKEHSQAGLSLYLFEKQCFKTIMGRQQG